MNIVAIRHGLIKMVNKLNTIHFIEGLPVFAAHTAANPGRYTQITGPACPPLCTLRHLFRQLVKRAEIGFSAA